MSVSPQMTSGAGAGLSRIGRTSPQVEMCKRSIADLRERLLDLSARNRLLNFSFSDRARQIRIVDEVPDELYKRLIQGSQQVFQPLPEFDGHPEDEETIEFRLALESARESDTKYIKAVQQMRGQDASSSDLDQLERGLRNRVRKELGMPPVKTRSDVTVSEWARMNGINPSYELPKSFDDLGTQSSPDSNHIQTLLFPKQMDRKLAGIREGARSALTEMGINVLFVALGFLEWYDSDRSDRALLAPLLLHPLDMNRTLVRQQYRYAISTTGEETETNHTLYARLVKDFGLVLPKFDQSDTLDAYFNRVVSAIEGYKGWKVRRFVAVSLFSFASIAMYHDLDPSNWNGGELLWNHPALLDLLTGVDVETNPYAEEYEVDSTEVANKVPTLIAPADASQFSAIADVMSGKNLVIHGPPGTGKSQTITNIIASALHKGKTVLFMAEKVAALEVVKKRLDQAGLGDFCLELHSTKARRKDVLEALKERLELGTVSSDGRLTNLQKEYDELRIELEHYCDLVNALTGNEGWGVHEILWAYIRSKDDALRADLPARLFDLEIDEIESYTPVDYQRRVSLLKTVEEKVAQFRDGFGSLYNHPWYGLKPQVQITFEQSRFRQSVENWSDSLTDLLNEVRAHAIVGAQPTFTISELTRLVRAIEVLPDNALVNIDVIAALTKKEERDAIVSFLADLHTYLDQEIQLGDFFTNQEELPAPNVVEDILKRWKELCKDLESFQSSVGQLIQLASPIVKGSKLAGEIRMRVGPLLRLVGIESEVTPTIIQRLVTAGRLARTLPSQSLALRSAELIHSGNQVVIASARDRAQQLLQERERLSEDFVLESAQDLAELDTSSKVLRAAGPFSFLSVDYRRAKRVWLAQVRSRRKADAAGMANDLVRIAEFHRGIVSFESDAILKQVCGQRFAGVDTNFDQLLQVAEFAGRVRSTFDLLDPVDAPLRRLLLQGDQESLDAFTKACNEVEHRYATLCTILERIGIQLNGDEKLAQLELRLTRFAEQVQTLHQDLHRSGFKDDVEYIHLTDVRRLLDDHDFLMASIDANEPARRMLRSKFSGAKTDVTLVKWCVALANQLDETCGEVVARHILQALSQLGLDGIRDIAVRLEAFLAAEELARHSVEDYCFIDWNEFIGAPDPEHASVTDLANRTHRLLAGVHEFASWREFISLSDEVADLGLEGIMEVFQREHREPEYLHVAFDVVFHQTLLRSVFQKNPELGQVSGVKQEHLRRRFQEVDRAMIKANSDELVYELLSRPIPWGNRKGPRGHWTDGSLVEHEISKRRRHIPLRELFLRASNAILTMKPCWMMSPLSIAQFTTPGNIEFDLLIVDEASQLRPEAAIGAIARARQIVVVGDPQQLPPTYFFDRMDLGEEDEHHRDEYVESESILDLARTTFRPTRRLRWHYRSRHESLIAFSNREFYDRSLVVFPSPFPETNEMGVRFINAQGIYLPGQRVNPIEAELVAKHAVEFMKNRPNKSLGIVCTNKAQTEWVLDLMNRNFALDPVAEGYRQHWEGTLEPFFVKNLENVQGDERDVIMVSTVFGPERAGGRVAQRFGPINSLSGHRRLNVLFTRAKEQLILVSSLEPSDILPSPSSHRGVHVLRNYIAYAKNGLVDPGIRTGRAPESDLEVFVARRLAAHGFAIVPQVGVDGYFVDIGVINPSDPQSFLAGIECDGATYHSTKSARERDHLREQRLNDLGWRIYRIWSTDWFQDPEYQTMRLVEYLRGLQEGAGVGNEKKISTLITEPHASSEEEPGDEPESTGIVLEVRSRDNEDSAIVDPGVKVSFYLIESPHSIHQLTYTDKAQKLSDKLVAPDSELGKILARAKINDIIEIPWNGARRKAVVLDREWPRYTQNQKRQLDSWRYL